MRDVEVGYKSFATHDCVQILTTKQQLTPDSHHSRLTSARQSKPIHPDTNNYMNRNNHYRINKTLNNKG